MHKPHSSSSLLFVAGSLFCLTACGGGGGASKPKPDTASRVVFTRATGSQGGTDLLIAPIAATSAPVNITRHSTERIEEVNGEVINKRLLYKATKDGNTNFYSVVVPQTGSQPPTQLTTFSQASVDTWGTVGNFLLLKVLVGNTWDLFAVPIDGSTSLRNLTGNTANTLIEWNSGFQTAGGYIFYELTAVPSGRTEVWSIKVDSATSTPLKMSVAQDNVHVALTSLDVDTVDSAARTPRAGKSSIRWHSRSSAPQSVGTDGAFSLPMLRKNSNTVVLLAENNAQTSFQYYLANLTNGSANTLTPSFNTSLNDNFLGAVVDNFLAYTIRDVQNDAENAFCVNLDAIPATPNPTRLTTSTANGTTIDATAYHPASKRVVLKVSKPDIARPGNSVADLFSVTLGDSTATKVLTVPSLHTNTEVFPDDIGLVLVVGSSVVFERDSARGKVWVASLDTSASEAFLLPTETKPHGLEAFVMTNQGSGTLEEVAMGPTFDATTLVINNAFVGVVTTTQTPGVQYSNFLSVQPGSPLRLVPITNQQAIADGILEGSHIEASEGSRVVYFRGEQLFSADVATQNSELRISGNTTTIQEWGVGPGTLGGNLVFFVAGGNLFSTPVNQSDDKNATRQLTDVGTSRALDLSDAELTTDRIAYLVREGGGSVIRVMSSPIAPAQPKMDDVSRPIDTQDQLVLGF